MVLRHENYHALVKVISGTAILVESSVIVAYGICVRPGTVAEDVVQSKGAERRDENQQPYNQRRRCGSVRKEYQYVFEKKYDAGTDLVRSY